MVIVGEFGCVAGRVGLDVWLTRVVRVRVRVRVWLWLWLHTQKKK